MRAIGELGWGDSAEKAPRQGACRRGLRALGQVSAVLLYSVSGEQGAQRESGGAYYAEKTASADGGVAT